MKSLQRTAIIVSGLAAAALAGCDTMSTRERSTAVGAGVGGVAGAAATDGSVLGTVGGAAIGGALGHEYGKRKERRDRDD